MKRDMTTEVDLNAAEQAAEWMLTLKEPDVARSDKESFVAWLRRSPVHVEEFLRISSLDAELSGRNLGIDIAALLADCVHSPTLSFPSPPPRKRGRVREGATNKRRWAIAASLILALGAASIFWLISRPSATYTTARGEQRSIALPDGSLLELNTQTTVRIAYAPAERKIILTGGEALFTVAPNPVRPFIVQAGTHTIRVLGTTFNVAERGKNTVVTVIDGAVAAGDIKLTAGQQLVLAGASSSRAPAQPRAVDPARATAWQHWKLYFDGESLAEAVEEFNRYNQSQLRIADPQLAQRRISGVFFANQPDSLIAFIASRDAVDVTESRDSERTIRLKTPEGGAYPHP